MKSAVRSFVPVSFAPAAVAAVVALLLVSFALPARAASLTQDQLSNVQALLQSYGVDDSKIKAVSAVLSDQGLHIGQGSTTPCAVPARALSRGMQNEDVKALQQRLSDDGYISEDNVSGFFGSTTQAALMRWQADQGIVATGTPDTTGWGSVGKRTLEALSRCEVRTPEDGQGQASSTPGMPSRGDRGGEHGQPMFPGGSGTPVPTAAPVSGDGQQSSLDSALKFVSDYSDAFNQNMAAVVTAPYDTFVPVLSNFFYSLGIR